MQNRANILSPAVSFVGRHNSGKTTLVEKIIKQLTAKGYDVGSVKHHTHGNFEIDVPGKDSYRHKEAGSTEVVVASPVKLARVKDLKTEVECDDLIDSMPGHDILIVEGYRESGLPFFEIMRRDNERDVEAAEHLDEILDEKTIAVVTDIPQVINYVSERGIPYFDINDVDGIVALLEEKYVRQKLCLVIQAGGESVRMGSPKELLEMNGKLVIQNLIDRFEPYVDEFLVTSNHPERLEGKLTTTKPFKICSDKLEKQGSLTGMYTAFAEPASPIVCCIACDMIYASEHLMASQIKILYTHDVDAVVPVNKHGREPFHSLYRREACLAAVERSLARGWKRAKGFLDDEQLRLYEMTQEEVREAVPRGGCFINVNTPEDLERLIP